MSNEHEVKSPLAVVGRLFWMMIGPLVLIFLAFAIARTGEGWLTALDVTYLAMLGGLVVARWLEFRGGDPRTADGQPATMNHLRRFAVVATLVGLGVWVAANVLGNHVLG